MILINKNLLLSVTLSFTCASSYAFKEQLLSFRTADSIVLSGTLTMPDQHIVSRKFPALLLLPGSGPTDRDGNQPPRLMTDLLKQIAAELANNGIASFRFDKRAAHSNKMQWPADSKKLPQFFSLQNHQADIEAAFKEMASSDNIDKNRVAILGHSEGGVLALVSLESLSPKALVLIGTPGRSLGNLISEQISHLLDKQNTPAAVKNEYLTKNAEIQKFISKNGTIPSDIPQGLKALYSPAASLFLKDILTLDPTVLLKKFQGPVLILNGELDTQVSPIQDAEALYKSLKTRKSSQQQILIVPSASHNLKTLKSPTDDGLSGVVDSKALSTLVEWLSQNL
jgi:alpha-beta hydrolase superfamily lysophospholipase